MFTEFNEVERAITLSRKPTHVVFQKIEHDSQVHHIAMGYANQEGLPSRRIEGEVAGLEFIIVPLTEASLFGYQPRDVWIEDAEPIIH